MSYGENYVSPPHLSRGLLVALADGLKTTPGQLAKKLDQPWRRADLYYIEKLSAILRRMDKGQVLEICLRNRLYSPL